MDSNVSKLKTIFSILLNYVPIRAKARQEIQEALDALEEVIPAAKKARKEVTEAAKEVVAEVKTRRGKK